MLREDVELVRNIIKEEIAKAIAAIPKVETFKPVAPAAETTYRKGKKEE